MIYIILGILIILFGITYRIYRIYIRYKNKQAKRILNEIKKRVNQGEENDTYLNILDEASYTIDIYKVIKKSKLSKAELEELLGNDNGFKKVKSSKVSGISKISLFLGKCSMVVSFIIGFIICLICFDSEPLYLFINALVIAQITCFIVIIISETIIELIKRRI